MDTNIGAKRARETRAALGVDAGSPLRCVLTLVEEAGGVPVVVAALPGDVAGACWRTGERAIAWVNGAHAVVRQRFTLAHEFGHVRIGHRGTSVDSPATLAGRTLDRQEVQANAFAAELLAPRAGVVDMVGAGPTLEDIVRLASRFGISTIAALFRLRTLGLSTPPRHRRLLAEIDAGLDRDIAVQLGLEPLDDGLARIEELPRLSPALAGSALAAALHGTGTVDRAARVAGCEPELLGPAVAALGRPRPRGSGSAG